MGDLRLPVLRAEGFWLGRDYGDTSACFMYGGQRICPVHLGQDYVRGIRGGTVVAMHDFRVLYVGGVGDKTIEWPAGMGGYGAILDLGGGFRQQTAHMVDGSCPLPVGAIGRAGDRIGEVGQTGTASGDHLHNDLIKDGRYIDPRPYLAAGSIPSTFAAAPGGLDMFAVTNFTPIVNRRGLLTVGANFRDGPSKTATALAQFPKDTIVVPFGKVSGDEVIGGSTDWLACALYVDAIGKTVVGLFHDTVVSDLEPIEAAAADASAAELQALRQEIDAAADRVAPRVKRLTELLDEAAPLAHGLEPSLQFFKDQ